MNNSKKSQEKQANFTGTLQPSNKEAEEALLSSLLLELDSLEQVKDDLLPEDFYSEKHKIIYQAILDLTDLGDPVDVTILDNLFKSNNIDIPASYLVKLQDLVPTAANIKYYAEIIKNLSRKRALIDFGRKIEEWGRDPEVDIETTLVEAQKKLDRLISESRQRKKSGLTAQELLQLEIAEPKWIVPGILPEGLTILSGKPKLGKSWMALGLSIAVASGGKALGSLDVERGGVLYFALEDPWIRLKNRLISILGEEKPPDNLVLYNSWKKLDEGGLGKLETEIKKRHDIRLVIIDTWVRFRGQRKTGSSLYYDDYQSFEGLKALTDKRKIGILVIHHDRKPGALDPIDMVSGTSGVTGGVDTVMTLRRERGKADAVLFVTGRDVEERELALRFDKVTWSWILLGEAEEVRLSKERQDIINLLREAGRAIGPKEVAEILNKPYTSIKLLLSRMAREGQLKSEEKGKYRTLDG